MNFRARSTFRAGSFAALEALLVPKLTAAVEGGAEAVIEISQDLVPVDTGALKSSGMTQVEWKGSKVTGYVAYTESYAAYVEMGTGQRGADSAGAGPGPYDSAWPGMPAQPYIRPAIDMGRARIMASFAAQGFKV